jgi:hypothetical protein
MVELVPSILSADFAHLADQIAAAERGGGTVIHVDVMDGHFVPNITIGPPVVKSLRKATKLPLDCHLMISNPNEFIEAFAEAGADWVSVHYEACSHLHRTLELILHHGMKPGVVINPATRVDLIELILPMVHHVLIMSTAWHLKSKWTAAWLTTPSLRSSKLVRNCWWRGMRFSAPAILSRMPAPCSMRPARPQAKRQPESPAGRRADSVRFQSDKHGAKHEIWAAIPPGPLL